MKAYKGFTRWDHASAEVRFWSKVDTSGECWIWLAAGKGGYGSFRVEGRSVAAHRFSWEIANGAIPEGLVLDHLCRQPACVNPAHLEPVTTGENMRRGLKTYALRTTCKNGHDITDLANVKVRSNGRRECRVCARASWHRSPAAERQRARAKRKAA